MAHAIDVGDTPATPYYSPVFITGVQVTDKMEAVELYNESSTPVNLSAWSIQYQGEAGVICSIQLESWILPDSYVTALVNTSANQSIPNVLLFDSCLRSATLPVNISLYNGAQMQETVGPIGDKLAIRKGLTKTYRSGIFTKDFSVQGEVATPNTDRKTWTLYAGTWYEPPSAMNLQINELLPNSRNCSPTETAGDCSDYVKIYNPTNQQIDLSEYRLRNGYLGQTPSASNTTQLSGTVDPGHFAVIPVSITNSGGWVWLEDSYGVQRYDVTVQEYPSAESDTKKGQAWAYDESDGIWKWTSQPTPFDSANVFPPAATESPKILDTLVPCLSNQYRSEETNRCRNNVAVASVVPCKDGQYRSEETNRCRSIEVASATLVPCKEGQERNADTNRCRNVVSSVPSAAFAVEPVKDTGKTFVGWWALGGVGLLAAGYAAWEWRREMRSGIQKVISVITSHKNN
jgi:hypothetical protein